jgi:hypothetical protein
MRIAFHQGLLQGKGVRVLNQPALLANAIATVHALSTIELLKDHVPFDVLRHSTRRYPLHEMCSKLKGAILLDANIVLMSALFSAG